MKKILVTGANGFIGQSLCKTLAIKNKLVHGIICEIQIKSKISARIGA